LQDTTRSAVTPPSICIRKSRCPTARSTKGSEAASLGGEMQAPPNSMDTGASKHLGTPHEAGEASRRRASDGEDGGRWSASLFGCLQEPVHAALCFLCACGCGPAYTFGKTRLLLDDSHRQSLEACLFCLACCTGISCMWGCTNRERLRVQFGIPGSRWSDCAAHCCCCQPCAVRYYSMCVDM